jgi:hypothetical protein
MRVGKCPRSDDYFALLFSSLLFLLSFLLPEMPLKLSKPQIQRFLFFTNT